MSSGRTIIRLSILSGISTWISLLVLDLLVLFSTINNVDSGIAPIIPRLIFSLFVLSLFAFYRYNVVKAESVNLLDLLWRVFVTGLITTLVLLLIKLVLIVFSENKLAENVFLINIFYHINVGLITAFLVSTYVVWQRLILYQKSKGLVLTWDIFQYLLLAAMVLNVAFPISPYSTTSYLILALLIIMSALLAVNLKWVAYLNFKQKWKSILFIVLVIIYLGYFFLNLSRDSNTYILAFDLLAITYVLALFAFILLYSIFSLLVILFNLPTSSVFEQKLKEALNFQRLSQSIPTGENEDQVYSILLDSAVSAVLADAAWLEIEDDASRKHLLLTNRVTEEQIEEVKRDFSKSKVKYLGEGDIPRSMKVQNVLLHLKSGDYKSAMLFPIVIKNYQIGTLSLLKGVREGFNREMVEIIHTFVSQACISVENFRLISEAIENERYKEELKIAKRVQKSLLPDELIHNEDYEISGYSVAADEVGGDYYDIYRLNQKKLALIIGDVSGKGTSAAFNMAQMKGVFHSLVQLDLSAEEFMTRANHALSSCLEKTSFITASLFLIDSQKNEVEFVRAGHCPTLFVSNDTRKGCFFKNRGLGLGIIRNSSFGKYVQTNRFKYEPGDVMVLYTDGIVEAKRAGGEEFGYDRLQHFVENNASESAEKIQSGLIQSLFDFSGQQTIDDDYTAMIVKFK